MEREFDISKINLKQPSLERKLTGEVLGSLSPDAPVTPNAELEHGEYVKFPDNTVQRTEGQKHSKAGIKLNIPDGTQIISNYLKVNAKDAKVISEALDVKIRPGETYASVLDKHSKKIGLKKLNDEQEDVFEELRKVLEKKDKTETQNINREFLSGKIKDIEDRKSEANMLLQKAFDLVFTIQESNKGVEPKGESFKFGGISGDRFQRLLDKHGLTKEQGLALMQRGGHYQDGGEKPFQDRLTPMEMAKLGSIARNELSEEEKSEFLEKLRGKYPDEGWSDYVNKMATEASSNPASPAGKIDNAKFNYLKDLEGFDANSPRNVEAVQAFIEGWKDRPDYKYSPVSQPMKDRLKEFVKMWGVEGYTDADIDKADIGTLNKIAGQLQSTVIEKAPELAMDYGAVAPPTKQGLEWLDKNGVINPKDNPEFYTKDGKISRGIGEDLDSLSKYKRVIENIPEDKKREYAEQNYKDNQWYFRSVGTKTVEFDDPEAYQKYLDDNKDNKVGDSPYFRTGKEGAYVQPILIKEQEFDSKEEAEKWAKDREDLYGDYYKSDDPNVYIRPKFKGQEEELKVDDIQDLGKPPSDRGPRMFYTPDQRTLPPTAMLPHLKVDTRLSRLDPLRVGIVPQLQQISDNRQFAADRLEDLPPSQKAAALASITASGMQVENQAIVNANQVNAQNLAQTELFNAGQRDRESLQNAQNALDYERRSYIARDVFDKNMRGWFDYNRRVALSDYDYNRKMNLASSIFPDYSPNFYGNWIDFDPDDPNLTIEDRRAVMQVMGKSSAIS